MYEQYIGKRVRLIALEFSRMYDFEGHTIEFNRAMVEAIKVDPYVEVLSTFGTPLMKARFSDGQVWMIIPEWIADSGVALFV